QEVAFKKYPRLEEAIKEFGYEGIEGMNYRTDNIKRTLDTIKHKSASTKTIKLKPQKEMVKEVASVLCTGSTGIKPNSFIPSAKVKNTLAEIYSNLGIKKNATAKDLGAYFDIDDSVQRIDGKFIRGIAIGSPIFSF